MKIVYLNPGGSLGGAERSLLDVICAVRDASPDRELELIAGSEGGLTHNARRLGIATHVIEMPNSVSRLGDWGAAETGQGAGLGIIAGQVAMAVPQVAAYAMKLRSFLRERKPDLVHSNGLKTHILSAWAAPPGARVLWHVRDYLRFRPVMSKLMWMHRGRCALAIANSRSVARDLAAVCGSKLNTHTIYNAIDLAEFSPQGPELDLDSLSGLPPCAAGSVRVGIVATLSLWKGHEVFLRAISMLNGDLPIRAYVIGGPIYDTDRSQHTLAELRERARTLAIDHRVGFTGFLDRPAAALRALDVVVHASVRPEPFGRVVAEAMACGRPVVASRAGGVMEIISEEHNALTHQPGDCRELAARIARLARDPELRRSLGDQARRWACQRFDRARMGGEITEAYDSVARRAN